MTVSRTQPTGLSNAFPGGGKGGKGGGGVTLSMHWDCVVITIRKYCMFVDHISG